MRHRELLLAAIVVATSGQTPPPARDVTLAFASPAYGFAAVCDPAKPLALINVLATNNGAVPAVFVVTAIDQTGALTGGTGVPSVPPGATVPVSIPLRSVGAPSPSRLAGTHVIDVSVRQLGARPIELQLPFPASLCATVATPPPPVNRQTMSDRPAVRVPVLTVAPPVNLRSVASGTDCGTHVGAIGALVCPDMMKSGDLLLIWDWQPGEGIDAIDGYRIYRIGRGPAGQRVSTELLATRTNKAQTLYDVPKLRNGAGYDGTCYVVTAFAGTKESARSGTFCASGGSAATTVRLAPSHVRHSTRGQFALSIMPNDTGPDVVADVTPLVGAWLRGTPNFGFVLKNSDENLDAFTIKSCVTTYAAPVLEVVYY